MTLNLKPSLSAKSLPPNIHVFRANDHKTITVQGGHSVLLYRQSKGPDSARLGSGCVATGEQPPADTIMVYRDASNATGFNSRARVLDKQTCNVTVLRGYWLQVPRSCGARQNLNGRVLNVGDCKVRICSGEHRSIAELLLGLQHSIVIPPMYGCSLFLRIKRAFHSN